MLWQSAGSSAATGTRHSQVGTGLPGGKTRGLPQSAFFHRIARNSSTPMTPRDRSKARGYDRTCHGTRCWLHWFGPTRTLKEHRCHISNFCRSVQGDGLARRHRRSWLLLLRNNGLAKFDPKNRQSQVSVSAADAAANELGAFAAQVCRGARRSSAQLY